ncbi:hypothetical protein AGMMS50225_10840 [Betaproteobacteria bacterium]|nr:hypothetical protein AGMMS50225_10840 [Betaproteobacteria bacterium]
MTQSPVVVAGYEAPALVALMRAWRAHDFGQVAPLNERFIAMRETAELRAETLQMGHSLTRLLREVEGDWQNFAPGLAHASGQHETQYTRLFRS